MIIINAARRVDKELREMIERIKSEALKFTRKKMTVVETGEEDRLDRCWATSSIIDTYIANSGTLGKKLLEEVHKLD